MIPGEDHMPKIASGNKKLFWIAVISIYILYTQGRAWQLLSVGINTPQQLAQADPHMLSQDIDHLYYKQAKRLVNSAKVGCTCTSVKVCPLWNKLRGLAQKWQVEGAKSPAELRDWRIGSFDIAREAFSSYFAKVLLETKFCTFEIQPATYGPSPWIADTLS